MEQQWATYYENRSAVAAGWFESEIRALQSTPVANEKEFNAVLSEFRSRISGLKPWRADAEMKLLLESVRDSFETEARASENRFESEIRALQFEADWREDARNRLNEEVDAVMFDDLVEQEEREKAKDAERRAKCAELGHQLGLVN